jgi:CheY-like chemotaxis protein/anti-sigma regulatory factor (Ser/Thr protein kinase)
MAEQRTQQLRDLAPEQTQIEQRERRRLASDLHDYLAQLLVVCKMDLGRLKKFVESPVGIDMITEMDRLLNDSLTYTRTLVAELSPTILYEAGLGPAFAWLAGQMHGHGLEVLVHDDGTPVLLPDDQAILVFQAARELLFNVIKHAGVRQATIDLATTPSEVVVTVSDQGEGFDIDPRTDRPRSGGFGLFNVRERLEAINGRFEIASTAGEGTTATLVVPLPGKPPEEPASSEPASIAPPAFPASVPEPEQRPIRVLLVDDHLAVRRVLRRILESDSDLQLVGEAVNGVEAVDMSRSLCPDVVLMDVNMPVMSGIEATRRIRQENLPVAVIALSANDDSGPVSPMKEAGAVAYLTKGASLDELRRTIRSACPSVLTTCMPPP